MKQGKGTKLIISLILVLIEHFFILLAVFLKLQEGRTQWCSAHMKREEPAQIIKGILYEFSR